MFIQANGLIFRRNQTAPFGKAIHANETAACIQIHAALGIVPVWNEGDMQSKVGKKIQPIHDMDILAHFVNLIDGQSMSAHGNGRRRSEHQCRTEAMPRPDHVPGQRILQLPDRVGRAARAHKDHVGMQ